jgi:hypothetical protein
LAVLFKLFSMFVRHINTSSRIFEQKIEERDINTEAA